MQQHVFSEIIYNLSPKNERECVEGYRYNTTSQKRFFQLQVSVFEVFEVFCHEIHSKKKAHRPSCNEGSGI